MEGIIKLHDINGIQFQVFNLNSENLIGFFIFGRVVAVWLRAKKLFLLRTQSRKVFEFK